MLEVTDSLRFYIRCLLMIALDLAIIIGLIMHFQLTWLFIGLLLYAIIAFSIDFVAVRKGSDVVAETTYYSVLILRLTAIIWGAINGAIIGLLFGFSFMIATQMNLFSSIWDVVIGGSLLGICLGLTFPKVISRIPPLWPF